MTLNQSQNPNLYDKAALLGEFLKAVKVRVPTDTLERIVRMYEELFIPEDQPEPFHFTVFPNEDHVRNIVVVKNIRFYSMCEHHLIPFYGEAHVGYLPHHQIVGLSKIPRLVDWYARRPQLQERLTAQVADYLHAKLDPKGVIVQIRATHLCMSMRGCRSWDAQTTTQALRGVFLASPDVRDEFFAIVDGG